MAFGQNYYPVEQQEHLTLENGDYTVTILSAQKKTYPNGDEYADVLVRIKGFDGYTPNRIILNEAPRMGQVKANGAQVTKEDIDRANGKLTRFFKAFNIADGNFNLPSWVNHEGTVHCDWQYDSKESDKKSKKYKQLTPVLNAKSSASSASPSSGATTSRPAEQKYTEDIPF